MAAASCLATIMALLLPPVAVVMMQGCGVQLLINLLLCLLGWIPGIIHALFVVCATPEPSLPTAQAPGAVPMGGAHHQHHQQQPPYPVAVAAPPQQYPPPANYPPQQYQQAPAPAYPTGTYPQQPQPAGYPQVQAAYPPKV